MATREQTEKIAADLLDAWEGVTAEDIIADYRTWATKLLMLFGGGSRSWDELAFVAEIDSDIRWRAERILAMLDDAANMIVAITYSHMTPDSPSTASGLARALFEAFTATTPLRLALTPDSIIFGPDTN